MSGSSIIIDVIVILVILLMTYLAAKRGFIRTLINLAGFIIAAFAANFLAEQLAQLVYTSFIRDDATTKIAAAITEYGGVSSALGNIEGFVSGFSLPFVDMGFAAGHIEQIGTTLSAETTIAAQQIADGVIAPIATPLIQAILFVILFIICVILTSIVARIISNAINMVPIVGGINKFLGAVVGAVEGLILVFLIAMAINLAISGSGDFWVFNNQSIEQTFLFKHFYALI